LNDRFWPKGDINGDESRLESINYAYETPANDPKETLFWLEEPFLGEDITE
jgi:hypothetical protein